MVAEVDLGLDDLVVPREGFEMLESSTDVQSGIYIAWNEFHVDYCVGKDYRPAPACYVVYQTILAK